MRKFKKVEETDDLLDELLGDIELNATNPDDSTDEGGTDEVEALIPEDESQNKKKAKKDKKDKKKKKEEPVETEEKDESFNPNGIPMVLERIEAGLIGSLKVTDDEMNSPVLKKGDIAQLRKPNRLLVKDFVFYKMGEDYYLRRIIKFKEDDIYVAGDNEKEYHIIHKDNILGKVIGRERGKKYLSFGFNPTNKFYVFCKVNLAPLRLGNRVKSYDEDVNKESFEAAMQNLESQAQKPAVQLSGAPIITTDIDLDSDLADFLDPDDLVKELRGEITEVPARQEEEEETEYVEEEAESEGEAVEYIQEGEYGTAPAEGETEESKAEEETESEEETDADSEEKSE